MKSKQIRLFITPYCPWCHKAEPWLREHSIGYQAIHVISDEAAYAEMISLSGQEQPSVIEVDGNILADFGPEQLSDFWKRLEDKDAHITSR